MAGFGGFSWLYQNSFTFATWQEKRRAVCLRNTMWVATKMPRATRYTFQIKAADRLWHHVILPCRGREATELSPLMECYAGGEWESMTWAWAKPPDPCLCSGCTCAPRKIFPCWQTALYSYFLCCSVRRTHKAMPVIFLDTFQKHRWRSATQIIFPFGNST